MIITPDILKRPIFTDKTTKLLEKNQYCFAVNPSSDKDTIKYTIEHLFKVKILKINSLHCPRKKKKIGRSEGYKAKYKKVIVTLSKDSKIDLFDDE